MPSLRGITIHLHSQFDVLTLPEYASSLPPPAAPSPPLRHLSRHVSHGRSQNDAYGDSPISDDGFAFDRPLDVPEDRIADVYVLVYPLSQFWIGYEIDLREIMEVSAEEEGTRGLLSRYELDGRDEVKFVYFKLLVNGQQTVEWGVRARRGGIEEEEGLRKGKVMFALFQRRDKQIKALEKRGFFFQGRVGDDEDDDDEVDCKEEEGVIEVRVYRARGRRRVGRKACFTFEDDGEMGVSLQPIGNAATTDPQRYYEYALTDAKDEPYTVLRYHICTTDQLLALGIVPGNRQDHAHGSTSSLGAESSIPSSQSDRLDQERPSSDDGDVNTDLDEKISHASSPCRSTWVANGLLVPPSKRLTPTTSIREPSSPVKKSPHPKDSLESVVLDRNTSLRDTHPGFGRFVVRTPSPGVAVDQGVISASPEEIQSARPSAIHVLKGVFNSALRRRMNERPLPRSPSTGTKQRLLDRSVPLVDNKDSSRGTPASSLESLNSALKGLDLDEGVDRPSTTRS